MEWQFQLLRLSLTLPLPNSRNSGPLHVMKYSLVKCLCVTMELLLLSTKIVACCTDVKLTLLPILEIELHQKTVFQRGDFEWL